jgi:predicted nuclease of predicted toxin-antitoxin system
MIRLKVDENLPESAAQLFRDLGHDACTVLDQGLNGKPDPAVAAACKSEGRTLITLDVGFGDIRAYPPEGYAGIVLLRPRNQGKAASLALLRDRVVPRFAVESPSNALWIVEEQGIRIRGRERSCDG